MGVDFENVRAQRLIPELHQAVRPQAADIHVSVGGAALCIVPEA